MAIRILRETGASRSAGYIVNVAAGVADSILPGIAVTLMTTDANAQTIGLLSSIATPYTGEILGLTLDSNIIFPFQSSQPNNTMGQGFDYTNYNRQGLIGVFNNHGEVELYDDNRLAGGLSSPIIYGDAFALNIPVYADCYNGTGKITITATNNKRVGRCTGVFGTGAAKYIRIIVEI